MKNSSRMHRGELRTRLVPRVWVLVAAIFCLAMAAGQAAGEPCTPHPNPNAAQDMQTVLSRGDVTNLPMPLKKRLAEIAGRNHSYLPVQAFAEADQPSQLFQYYLLDTAGFEPNVFTAVIPGVNDSAMKTATGANCGAATIA